MMKKMKVIERRLRLLEFDVDNLCDVMMPEPEYKPAKNAEKPSYIG